MASAAAGGRLPRAKRPRLQDGLGEERQQTIPAPLGGALHLGDVGVRAPADDKVGAVAADWRLAPDLPARASERVRDTDHEHVASRH